MMANVPEAALLEYDAGTLVAARVAEAGVDDVLAGRAVVAGRAHALEAALGPRQTLAAVAARRRGAGVALGQHAQRRRRCGQKGMARVTARTRVMMRTSPGRDLDACA